MFYTERHFEMLTGRHDDETSTNRLLHIKPHAAQLSAAKLVQQELFFKGYFKIPSTDIDASASLYFNVYCFSTTRILNSISPKLNYFLS